MIVFNVIIIICWLVIPIVNVIDPNTDSHQRFLISAAGLLIIISQVELIIRKLE